MPSIYLSSQSFIKVRGKSAFTFLQGIITADITSLPFDVARGSALLTPQGKILFYFLISKIEEDIFVLEINKLQRDSFIEKLLFYKLRSDVALEVQPINGITLSWNQEQAPTSPSFIDERFSIAGILLHRTWGYNEESTSDPKEYHELRINYGIVEPIPDFPPSTIFPHDALMDLVKGISFTKGCYVGQEVVSRMQHRNIVRKRPIIIKGYNAFPANGSSLFVDNTKIGTLGIIVGKKALAIARIDKVSNAIEKNMALTVDGIKVTITLPPWCGSKFSAH